MMLHRQFQGQYAKVDNYKYSENNPNWQNHLEKNYKSDETKTYFKEIPKAADIKPAENIKASNILDSNQSVDIDEGELNTEN